MINRNVDEHFASTPTPHYPRSRFDMQVHKRLQTQGHGRLYPFFCRAVYPGDTWQMDMTTFVRADTSLRVPLDDIVNDIYWFFVPYRILDKNFVKILGEGEPEEYDDVSYGFPQLRITAEDAIGTINSVLPYLGYNQAVATVNADGSYSYNYSDEFCAYPLMAYYKIYNSWFRDENVDASIPIDDLPTIADLASSYIIDNALFDGLQCLKVNRLHDYYSSSVISPQKGPAQTVLNSNSAPVFAIYGGNTQTLGSGGFASFGYTNDTGSSQTIANGDKLPGNAIYSGSFSNTTNAASVSADLSQANATINDLRLAFAIQALYEKRGTFGTRYISVLRGQWGLDVPDLFLQRPEYLGGSRVCLNNMPVLSTENSSQLGQMSGNSATLSQGGSWSKTFVDYGLIIGVSCTRVKHSFTQGKRQETFMLKTQLDLYNPVFANIGKQKVPTNTIFNTGTSADDVAFAYQEPYGYLRTDEDSFAGLFGVFSSNSEIKTKWHYGDYYASAPSFSADWLKEDFTNVARTMTGTLIAGAGSTETEGHQFMFGYYYHPIVTRILPANPIPATLVNHL